jgi:uncharacterized protein
MKRAWLPPPAPESTCLVTGASAGIGMAIARELASRGYGVALVARRQERLVRLAAELRAAHGVRAEALPCDLADPAARARLPRQVADLGLAVEILVNNAGLGTYGAFVASDGERQLEQVRVMSEAVVDLARAFAPAMAERRRGAVLIVSSALALAPMPGYATYCGTRAFCLAFGDALHAELRRVGVAVTTVCPGGVSSEFFAANGPQPVQWGMPRFMWRSPEQVAGAAIDALARNKRMLVPGRPMRAAMAGRWLVPRALQWTAMDRLAQRGERTSP